MKVPLIDIWPELSDRNGKPLVAPAESYCQNNIWLILEFRATPVRKHAVE